VCENVKQKKIRPSVEAEDFDARLGLYFVILLAMLN